MKLFILPLPAVLLLMNPISERNWRSAPVYFKALEDHITILDRAEQQKLLKIQLTAILRERLLPIATAAIKRCVQ